MPPQWPEQTKHRVTFGPNLSQGSTPSLIVVDPECPYQRLQQATQKNLAWVDEVNLEDTVSIGELGYLRAAPPFYFAAPVEGPDDFLDTPDWFLNKLQKIALATIPAPTKATVR
jgi:hypothetical protein